MTSQNSINDAEISRLLLETSDAETQVSDRETKDNLLEDDVQSDGKEYEVSAPPVVNTLYTEDMSENNAETPESASPSMPSYIVMPQRQPLRGKNEYRWTATKGRTSRRISSANIIRTSRGPTRMNKCLYEPLECFSIFITDDIVEEITKWTKAEIQLKIQNPDVKAEPPTEVEGLPEPKKRKYCVFCPSKIRMMTKTMCDKCKNPICGEHKSNACPKCL